MPLVRLQVVSVGAKVPKIVNDPDYEEKSLSEDNYYPAVLVAIPPQHVTPVIVSKETAKTVKVGDFVTINTSDEYLRFWGSVPL